MIRIAVLISGQGRGSNMQAIIGGCQSGVISGEVVRVIGTRSDSPAITRAADLGIATKIISPRKFESDPDGYGKSLLMALTSDGIDLVCLGGYMLQLPHSVVHEFSNRIMNIHPALLPLFGGKGMFGEHVHQAVIKSGMKVSGCTVHFVDEHYDTGPIVLQTVVPVEEEDRWETLAARVLKAEHESYVEAVRLFSTGCLKVVNGIVRRTTISA